MLSEFLHLFVLFCCAISLILIDLELGNTQFMNDCLANLAYLTIFVTDAIVDDKIEEGQQSGVFLFFKLCFRFFRRFYLSKNQLQLVLVEV